jgi:outer membrane protein assembly factor BamD (BamD/ComL family)
VLFTLSFAAVAEARAPNEIEDDATDLLISVQGMDPSDLAAGFRGSGDSGFVEQLADGELNYALERYNQAALVLAELVEHPDAFDEPGYPRALHLLGDSLYRIENFGLAQSYYQRLFDLDDDEYSLDAGLRLVEVELKTRDYEEAIAKLEEVEARYGDVAGDALTYVRGKVRYESGSTVQAIEVFDRIEAGGEYYPRAQYLAGVAETKNGRYEVALDRFANLQTYLEEQPDLNETDAEVRELNRLAQARIYYEFENWSDAVYHYSQVDPDSEQFDSALYEMSWTMINEERYQDAAYNLEVLAEISNDTRFIAESRLLAGNMKRRAEQYQEAQSLFKSTGDDYGLIWRQVDEIVNSDQTVASMYQDLSELRTGGVDAEVEIEDWVTEDPLVARSLLYVKNAAQIQSWLEEGGEVIRELQNALGENNIYEIFPAAGRFRGTMSTYWRQAVFLRAEAVDEHYRAISARLTESQRQDYQSLLNERKQLMERFETMDFRVSVDESGEGDDATASLDAMIADLGATESELEGSIDEIDELQTLLRQQVGRGDISPDEAVQMEQELSSTRDQIFAQLEEVRARRRQLLEERSEIAGDAPQTDGDTESMRVLREILSTMRAEKLMLMEAVELENEDDFAEIYSTLDTIDARLNTLRGALGNALARRREVYHNMINLERRRLLGMQGELSEYSEEGTEVTSDIAMESLMLAHERIGDVVLRANLGSIDVSWWQKESISQRIEKLFDEKSRQLQILDADFAEILGGR